MKIDDNGWQSVKIGENRWKSVQIAENRWKLLKIVENLCFFIIYAMQEATQRAHALPSNCTDSAKPLCFCTAEKEKWRKMKKKKKKKKIKKREDKKKKQKKQTLYIQTPDQPPHSGITW